MSATANFWRMPLTAAEHARQLVWWALLFSAAFAHFCAVQPYGLGINKTPSLPKGLYLTKQLASQDTLAKGDWVCLPYAPPEWALARQYMPVGSRVCKPVAGLSGDTVHITAKSISVVGADTAFELMDTDSKGKPVPKFSQGAYTLASDDVLLLSAFHPRSLDSRILGTVKRGQVTHRIWPLLTGSRQPA